MIEFTNLPPLSLYIHIPWCIRKCPYCDFNSHEFNNTFPEDEYIAALIHDLEYQLPSIWGRRIISLFIGGGTPSVLSPRALDNLLGAIRSRLSCLPEMEITMEANPGTVDQNKFNEFHSIGINRLSIGIQSFNDTHLQKLGRVHSAREAIRSVEIAQQAGFDNFNLDLMFGLPEQNQLEGINDLKTAIDLQPTHISWYQLTIEPNTLFYKQTPVLPEDDDIWSLQQQGQTLLQKHGFNQYEISAYAKHNKQCQHNLNYWQFGDYLALGAGAHGKISRSDTNSINRYWKLRQPQAYIDASAEEKTSGQNTLKTEDIIFEFMLNALRLKEGFEIQTFETHTGLSAKLIESTCTQAIEKGLLEKQGPHLKPSELGYRFLNDLINLFN
ncbi:MAG: radical SAM family heme chaperone HemW [Gammaproteobacteria bacterium]|nr:radical SAM family heme chaperone HemW [Gammaproteobacteria bacterium]